MYVSCACIEYVLLSFSTQAPMHLQSIIHLMESWVYTPENNNDDDEQ